MARSILKEAVAVRPWRPLPPSSPTTWVPQPAGSGHPINGSGETACGATAGSGLDAAAPPGTALLSGEPESPEALLERAQHEAELIVQQARIEADHLREEARREGYEAGRASGLAELAAERQKIGELVAQMDAAFGQFCLDQVPALAEIASEATTRLVREQLTVEPERVLTIVTQALEHASASARIILHLHPADEEWVRQHLATRDARQTGSVELVADATMERGGCWLETEHGEVDATVSGRLSRLTQALDEIG